MYNYTEFYDVRRVSLEYILLSITIIVKAVPNLLIYEDYPTSPDEAHILGLTGSSSGNGEGILLDPNYGIGEFFWYVFINFGTNTYEFFLNYDSPIDFNNSISVFRTDTFSWQVGDLVAASGEPGCGLWGLNKACDTLKLIDLPTGVYYIRLDPDWSGPPDNPNMMRLTWNYPSSSSGTLRYIHTTSPSGLNQLDAYFPLNQTTHWYEMVTCTSFSVDCIEPMGYKLTMLSNPASDLGIYVYDSANLNTPIASSRTGGSPQIVNFSPIQTNISKIKINRYGNTASEYSFQASDCFGILVESESSTAGSVSISPSPNCGYYGNVPLYVVGTGVTITANPKPGYQFLGWNGSLAGYSSPTVNLTVSRNISSEALFTQISTTPSRTFTLTSTRTPTPTSTLTPTAGISFCSPQTTLSCGGSDSRNNGGAGSTNQISSYSCSAWNESGPEYTYTFVPNVSGSVTVSLSNLSADLDIFVLNNATGDCRAGNCIAVGDSSATFTAAAGQTYYLVVDGYLGAVGNYTISVQCSASATNTPTPSPTFTPWFTSTFTPTLTPSRTFTPPFTSTFTPTLTPSRTFTPPFTSTFTRTPTLTNTSIFTSTFTRTPTRTATPTRTVTPSKTPTPPPGGYKKVYLPLIIKGSSQPPAIPEPYSFFHLEDKNDAYGYATTGENPPLSYTAGYKNNALSIPVAEQNLKSMIYFGSSINDHDNTYKDVMYTDHTVNVWINISELNSWDEGGDLAIVSGQPQEAEGLGGCEGNINHWGLFVSNVAGNNYGNPISPGNEYFHLFVLSYSGSGVPDQNYVSLRAIEGQISANQWYMLTITHDVDTHTWKFYVNGQLKNSVTKSAGIGPAGQIYKCNYAIGNRPIDHENSVGTAFPGQIDELGFWNQVLTPEQIAALYGMR